MAPAPLLFLYLLLLSPSLALFCPISVGLSTIVFSFFLSFFFLSGGGRRNRRRLGLLLSYRNIEKRIKEKGYNQTNTPECLVTASAHLNGAERKQQGRACVHIASRTTTTTSQEKSYATACRRTRLEFVKFGGRKKCSRRLSRFISVIVTSYRRRHVRLNWIKDKLVEMEEAASNQNSTDATSLVYYLNFIFSQCQ